MSDLDSLIIGLISVKEIQGKVCTLKRKERGTKKQQRRGTMAGPLHMEGLGCDCIPFQNYCQKLIFNPDFGREWVHLPICKQQGPETISVERTSKNRQRNRYCCGFPACLYLSLDNLSKLWGHCNFFNGFTKLLDIKMSDFS